MPSVSFEDLLARNLRAYRAAANLSQAQISRRMQALGFMSWQRSTMSLVEQGKRKLTAAELVGLALVLNVKPERQMYPDRRGDRVAGAVRVRRAAAGDERR